MYKKSEEFQELEKAVHKAVFEEEIRVRSSKLTLETMSFIVTGEKGLTSAIAQVTMAVGDVDLAVPVSVTLVAELQVR